MSTPFKAAVVHTFGDELTVDELQMRRAGAGRARGGRVSCGGCRTDRHAAPGGGPGRPPRTPRRS